MVSGDDGLCDRFSVKAVAIGLAKGKPGPENGEFTVGDVGEVPETSWRRLPHSAPPSIRFFFIAPRKLWHLPGA